MKIRLAKKADVPRLDQALRTLSIDLGDVHRADEALLLRAGFGVHPVFHAVVAESSQDKFDGVAIFSPRLSTTFGACGIYISDLWVSRKRRGGGLGPLLIKQAVEHARSMYGCEFVHLSVYRRNSAAIRFYQRLGFDIKQDDQYLALSGEPLARLLEITH